MALVARAGTRCRRGHCVFAIVLDQIAIVTDIITARLTTLTTTVVILMVTALTTIIPGLILEAVAIHGEVAVGAGAATRRPVVDLLWTLVVVMFGGTTDGSVLPFGVGTLDTLVLLMVVAVGKSTRAFTRATLLRRRLLRRALLFHGDAFRSLLRLIRGLRRASTHDL